MYTKCRTFAHQLLVVLGSLLMITLVSLLSAVRLASYLVSWAGLSYHHAYWITASVIAGAALLGSLGSVVIDHRLTRDERARRAETTRS